VGKPDQEGASGQRHPVGIESHLELEPISPHEVYSNEAAARRSGRDPSCGGNPSGEHAVQSRVGKREFGLPSGEAKRVQRSARQLSPRDDHGAPQGTVGGAIPKKPKDPRRPWLLLADFLGARLPPKPGEGNRDSGQIEPRRPAPARQRVLRPEQDRPAEAELASAGVQGRNKRATEQQKGDPGRQSEKQLDPKHGSPRSAKTTSRPFPELLYRPPKGGWY